MYEADGINDAGYIVGSSIDPSGNYEVVLWRSDDPNATVLGTFGAQWSNAVAINNSGVVVGTYGSAGGPSGSFLWSQSGGATLLPQCAFADHGDFGPVAINDEGVVVGDVYIDSQSNVATWSHAKGYTLVGPGRAYAINDSGIIVGEPATLGVPMVWQPVPEPSAFAALACGLVGILVQMRRRPNV